MGVQISPNDLFVFLQSESLVPPCFMDQNDLGQVIHLLAFDAHCKLSCLHSPAIVRRLRHFVFVFVHDVAWSGSFRSKKKFKQHGGRDRFDRFARTVAEADLHNDRRNDCIRRCGFRLHAATTDRSVCSPCKNTLVNVVISNNSSNKLIIARYRTKAAAKSLWLLRRRLQKICTGIISTMSDICDRHYNRSAC